MGEPVEAMGANSFIVPLTLGTARSTDNEGNRVFIKTLLWFDGVFGLLRVFTVSLNVYA